MLGGHAAQQQAPAVVGAGVAAAVRADLDVEIVVAEKIGRETTTYVRNIYKYYAAYRLTQEAEETLRLSREKLAPGAK